MKIIIIGGNLAGITAARELKKLANKYPAKVSNLEVIIFDEEDEYFYPRPKLAEYLSGIIDKDKLIVHTENWFKEHDIDYQKNVRILDIIPEKKSVRTAYGEEFEYDKLLIATGARPFIPPIKGSNLDKIFTFRNLIDIKRIQKNITTSKHIAVIGGGLLGIESAKAFNNLGLKVSIIERSSWPMARQLDEKQGLYFKEKLKPFNFKIYTNALGYEFIGKEGKVNKIKFTEGKDAGKEIEVDMVIISTGIRANIEIATNIGVGIKTNRGIVVNKFMETNISGIFAAGDCCECPYTNIVWGNIPAALAQAKVAAENILFPESVEYQLQKPELRLKISEITMQAIGMSNPTKEYNKHYFTESNGQICIYENNNEILGANFVGTTKGWTKIRKAIKENRKIENLTKILEKADINKIEEIF